jgi:hypothetical protein
MPTLNHTDEMKNVPWVIWIVFIVIAGTGWGLWIHDRLATSNHAIVSTTATVPRMNPPASRYIPIPNQTLWHEYMLTRQKVLEENPDLAAEFNELQGEFGTQQKDLEAAMIKIDPKVRSILTKVNAARQQGMAAQFEAAPFRQRAPSTTPPQ